MNWTELLKTEAATAFTTAERLLDKVDAESLEWKPATGANWMTVGQLLMHLSEGCGGGCRAFLTGDWGLPEGARIEDLTAEEMLPPAERLPAIESVEAARLRIAADRELTFLMIDQAGEETLGTKQMAAPWTPGVVRPLGWHFLQMIQHLDRHKAQLFYYLKLQGKPVRTPDLWG